MSIIGASAPVRRRFVTARRAVPPFVPLLNPLMAIMIRLGIDLGPKMALITVHGRKTGRAHTTPITLFEHGSRRFVFGTFGDTSWVRNARSAGKLILTRGRRSETVSVVEIEPQDAAPILTACLSKYLDNPTMAPMLRRFYGVARGASAADFARVAREHPAFELVALEAGDER